MSKLEILGLGLAAVAAGTIYVLVHEKRRKAKKEAAQAANAPISKEMLLQILNKSAEASKAVIERVRVQWCLLPSWPSVASIPAERLLLLCPLRPWLPALFACRAPLPAPLHHSTITTTIAAAASVWFAQPARSARSALTP